MTASSPRALPTVGFLSVVEDEAMGFFGGYLVLNTSGRPVEFHCTAPVQPSRAQRILYGPTLRPHVYAERIAPALLEKPKSRPAFICTDSADCLGARDQCSAPMIWLSGDVRQDEVRPGWHSFSLGELPARTLSRHATDEEAIRLVWSDWLIDFDLLEPFGRIREAISEAQKSVRAAA